MSSSGTVSACWFDPILKGGLASSAMVPSAYVLLDCQLSAEPTTAAARTCAETGTTMVGSSQLLEAVGAERLAIGQVRQLLVEEHPLRRKARLRLRGHGAEHGVVAEEAQDQRMAIGEAGVDRRAAVQRSRMQHH